MGSSPSESGRAALPPRLDTSTAHSARVWNYLLGGKDKPVALMMLGIMGQLPDSAGPRSIVTTLLDALPPGSYLALSDGTDTSPALNQAIAAYNQNSTSSYHLRSPAAIARFFDGLTLVSPGVVTTSRWRPDLADASAEPREVDAICGVARKD